MTSFLQLHICFYLVNYHQLNWLSQACLHETKFSIDDNIILHLQIN